MLFLSASIVFLWQLLHDSFLHFLSVLVLKYTCDFLNKFTVYHE